MRYYAPTPVDSLANKIGRAINTLLERDGLLLETRVNERSVSHKLAEYLQVEFPDWNVDCEYNRKGNAIKELESIADCDEERRTDKVYPDIIIHRRKTNDNLLVIEIKTNAGATICDIAKLQRFTTDPEYRYRYGLFIQFKCVSEPELIWFVNGRETPEGEVEHEG